VIIADSNFAFKIATKQLQIETWSLLTVDRNSSLPYPAISLLTPYDVRYSRDGHGSGRVWSKFLKCVIFIGGVK